MFRYAQHDILELNNLLRAKITIKIEISNKYPEKVFLLAQFYIYRLLGTQVSQVLQLAHF